MSEYQCYEFVALECPLTRKQMAELRAISTRAEITPTRFWNEYHWGDLKADPAKLLARYFDAHLYFANWGTRRLMFRLPARPELRALRAYFPGGPARLARVRQHWVMDLVSDTEEPDEDWFEGGRLAALTPLRAELASGDLRCAYLAWLATVHAGHIKASTLEPPVPAGLGNLAGPHLALVEFLRLDESLVRAAAEASPDRREDSRALRAWLRRLPVEEKERWLLRVLEQPDRPLGGELLATYRSMEAASTQQGSRRVSQLLARADELRAEREEADARRAARARAAAEAARTKRLAALSQREEAAWEQLERLVDTKKYPDAVQLALDLRQLASRASRETTFESRLEALKRRLGRRRGFFEQFRYAVADAAGADA